MPPICEIARSGRIPNVMVLPEPRHFLIGNNAFVQIGNGTKGTVPDVLNISLLSGNGSLKLPLKLLEGCFGCREASRVWAQYVSTIVRSLPDMVSHILGQR